MSVYPFRLFLVVLAFLAACRDEECGLPDPIPDPDPDPVPACHLLPAPIYNPGEPTYGLVAGFKNCRPFAASAWGGWYQGIDSTDVAGLTMNTFETWSSGFIADKEHFFLWTDARGLGRWPIIPHPDPLHFRQGYTIAQDHHELEAFYFFDSTFLDNHLTITSLDTITGEIEGVFTIQFYKSTPNPPGTLNPLHPDTVRFEDCHFFVRKR